MHLVTNYVTLHLCLCHYVLIKIIVFTFDYHLEDIIIFLGSYNSQGDDTKISPKLIKEI